MAKAIDKAREFAGLGDPKPLATTDKKDDIEFALSGGITNAPKLDTVDLSEVEGLDPSMPIQESLSNIEGEIVYVVSTQLIDNQFAADRVGANPKAAEFIYQRQDGRFYRSVSSNIMALKNQSLFTLLLARFNGITCRVIGVDVKGQINKAYGFTGTGQC